MSNNKNQMIDFRITMITISLLLFVINILGLLVVIVHVFKYLNQREILVNSDFNDNIFLEVQLDREENLLFAIGSENNSPKELNLEIMDDNGMIIEFYHLILQLNLDGPDFYDNGIIYFFNPYHLRKAFNISIEITEAKAYHLKIIKNSNFMTLYDIIHLLYGFGIYFLLFFLLYKYYETQNTEKIWNKFLLKNLIFLVSITNLAVLAVYVYIYYFYFFIPLCF